MKLPDKFYQNLALFLLAILAAFLLSFFVSRPQAAIKANLSVILAKGPSINEEINASSLLIKWLFAFLAAFTAVQGRKYWQRADQRKDVALKIKKYKETLRAISSLETKSGSPEIIKRKQKRTVGQPSVRFSDKQTGKIINSSRSLSRARLRAPRLER